MKNIAIRHFHSHTPEKKKRRSWKRWLVFILIVVCFGAFVYFVNLPQYQIKNIVVKGAVLTDESKVKEIANADIAGRYFYIIPKSFFLTYPKSQIRKDVGAILSVLDSDADVDGANNLNITLTERAQKYLWCASSDSSSTSSKCFYMDGSGLVFTEAPELEGNVFVVFSGLIAKDASGNVEGQHFLPAEKMAELVAFIDSIKNFGLNAKAVNAASISEIHIIIQSGTDIIVSLEKPLDSVLSNLKILKASPDFINASGGIEKLKYIDLRYGSKAFWK